jgi:hypothetical protein
METAAAAALLVLLAACGGDRTARDDKTGAADSGSTAATDSTPAPGAQAATPAPGEDAGPRANTGPNELGRLLVLEYHRIGNNEGEWVRSEAHFRNDLQMLWDRGYRPVTMRDVANGNINLPEGTSPVVFVFDDSSLGQFYYLPSGEIDPHTMVGMWEAFRARNPGWRGGGTWCVLPGATHPSNFWGEKPSNSRDVTREQREGGIRKKVSFLVENGHEICNHTMWHAQLSKYPDAFVQDQIGSGQDSISAYLPQNYAWTTFALPLGMWPKTRSLAWHGTYRNGKTYDNKVVLEVAGGPQVSPFDRAWNGHSVRRFIAAPNALERQLAAWDAHPGERYVSDGDPNTVSYPQRLAANLNQAALGNRRGRAVADAAATTAAAPAPAAPRP